MGLAVLGGIVAGLPATTSPAAAQTLPGIGDAKGTEINSEYLAFLRDSSREVMARWEDAWFNDRVGELTELYAHNAVLTTPDGGARRGDVRISAYLSQFLPRVGGVTTSSVILDGSGDLAFIYGRYQLEGAGGLSEGTGDQGDHLTVLFQHRRQWTIRNQAFASKAQTSGIPWAPGEVEEPLPPLDLSQFSTEAVDNVDWLTKLYPTASSLTVSFNDVWSSGNVGGLLSFSTDDLFMRTIQGEFLVGKEAVGEALRSPDAGFANTIYLGPVDFTASTMVSILHARYYLEDRETGGALSQGTVFLLLEGSGNDLALRGMVFAPTSPGN
jgi:ketosteroid isomerase-like protein